MATRSPENFLLRKTRFLTQALILSGTLNIGLVTTFIYFVMQEKHAALAIELKPLKKEVATDQATNSEFLHSYSLLPYQELLARLENKEFLEEGLSKRDLALTCLVAFHHFHLEKALTGVLFQKRSISFKNSEGQEKIDLPVFPGLSDEQFQAVILYAKTEKWPLTSQGLYYELKRSAIPRDASLVESFCLTSEYDTISTLFSKTGFPLARDFLIDLLCEGEWKSLSDLTQMQRQALDLSPDRRRAVLLSYLNNRSKCAARLLLETDLEFLLKRCDDSQILTLFDLSDDKCSNLEHFAKGVLASPRADVVYKRAALALYTLAGEPLPDPYDHRITLQRFFPQVKEEPSPLTQAKEIPPPQVKKKMYTIENGDSLWKISKKFHVSIDEIKRVNHLDTEKLRPGKQLEIPIKETKN